MKIKILLILLLITIFPVVSNATELVIIATDTAIATSTSLTFSEPLPASFTVDQLFDRMEKKSETINAIEAEVELYDKISTSTVTLRVKSPDKFSIVFSDRSSSVYFNGNKLWIYIKELNECFYHFSEPNPWLDKLGFFTTMFEPKKIFVNMTRGTLKAIFEIESVKREKTTDNDYRYHLKLTPKFKDIFIQVFELGYYEAIFSEKIYLPVEVKEYDSKGTLKSTLSVNSYKMNGNVQDDLFEFKNETNAVFMPISIVIMQKFEDYKDKLMKKIDDTTESLKNSILKWSF